MNIVLCINTKCTKRSKCMRYRGVPSHRQAFGRFEQDSNGNCDFFFDVTGWNNTQLIPTHDADRRNGG